MDTDFGSKVLQYLLLAILGVAVSYLLRWAGPEWHQEMWKDILYDRSAAIEACAAVQALNDPVPNPRAGQPSTLPGLSPQMRDILRQPNFIRPSAAEMNGRIAHARSRAAASRDRTLQSFTNSLQVTSDSDGRSQVVTTRTVEYCRQQGY